MTPSQATLELVRRSRAEQGLPPTVEDPEVLRQVAAIFASSAQFSRASRDLYSHHLESALSGLAETQGRPAPNGPGGEPTMSAASASPMMSHAEVAEYLGISVQKLRKMVRAQQIPHLRLGYRSVRFLRSDIEAWRETKRVAVSQ